MMKKEYETPNITVIALDTADIITTSERSENGFDGIVDDSW